jgi:hypothetical protein
MSPSTFPAAPEQLRPSRLPLPPAADLDLADRFVEMSRAGYPLVGFEVAWKDGERISLHATIEDALSFAELLWDGEQHEEHDGSVAFVGEDFDGETYCGVTFGFVREVQP